MMRRLPDRSRGVAAIIAILIVALAASSATYLVSRYSLALRHAENLGSRAQADQLARTAVFWVASILTQDLEQDRRNQNQMSDHRGEMWALPLPPLPAEDATVEGRIQDEQAKFNLNNLAIAAQQTPNPQQQNQQPGQTGQQQPDQQQNQQPGQQGQQGDTTNAMDKDFFERLLSSLKLDPRLVDALIDWIDADDQVTTPQGAESTTYLGLPVPYRAANTLLTDIGELGRIKGFDRNAIEKLLPFVTALPVRTKINVNTAPVEVVLQLSPGIQADGLAKLFERRDRERKAITREEFMQLIPKEQQDKVGPMIDFRSDYFSASGVVRRGRVVAGYRALFERASGQPGQQGQTTRLIGLVEEPI